MNEKLLYDVNEAAERLGLPISKVRQVAKSGALGCRRIGKYLRFAAEDLRVFVEQAKAA
jgi:excisionase family DNA binding protein